MLNQLRAEGRWSVRCYQPHDLTAWKKLNDQGYTSLHDLLSRVGAQELWREEYKNAITAPAMNDLLSTQFLAGTQKPNWYFGLVDNAGFTSFNSADTMGSHAGWAESVAYGAANRVAWTPGSPSGGIIINGTPQTVTMSGSATIHGAFITSDNTKSGTSGILWATGAFAANQVLTTSQVLSLQYSLTLSNV